LSDHSEPEEEAGPPDVGRLLIPEGLNPAALRASRIDAPVRKLSGATMGTGWSLSFAAPDDVANTAVISTLEDTFALVIGQMSGWAPTSDLSRFNRAAPGWYDLKPEFFNVLMRALEIAKLTDGAYDPALGAIVDALGFGPTPPATRQATSHDRDNAGGWRSIRLDSKASRAWQPGGVTLDLSSIAKGAAVDLCAARLGTLGVPSFLMEIGGEFTGRGVKPDGQPWRVQLELSDRAPAPGEPSHIVVAMANISLATSGDFVRKNDAGASHILDGRTALPVSGRLSGASVLDPLCMDADAWTTALFALGLDEGLALAEAKGLAAVFAVRTAAGAKYILSARAAGMAT
jgi:thiamine biosynthesis lipoprotein